MVFMKHRIGLGGLKVWLLNPIKVKSMDKIYSKVLENDFDVSYDEFVQYLRLVFNLMTTSGRYREGVNFIFGQSKSEFVN